MLCMFYYQQKQLRATAEKETYEATEREKRLQEELDAVRKELQQVVCKVGPLSYLSLV